MCTHTTTPKDWPEFHYDLSDRGCPAGFRRRAGRAGGLLKGLTADAQAEAAIEMMVEAINTSAIEGELLSRKDVMSSIRKNLGMDGGALIGYRRPEGAAALMIDVRNGFTAPLSEEKLFEWHKMIIAGSRALKAGEWRTHAEPVQVVSGPVGKERVHFETPSSSRVPGEMMRFIDWFNETGSGGKRDIKKAVMRLAVAHLYFGSIHPFEDGKDQIGRALSEKALSQGIGQPALLNLSRAIERHEALL
jgi:Fic family protein